MVNEFHPNSSERHSDIISIAVMNYTEMEAKVLLYQQLNYANPGSDIVAIGARSYQQ